MLCTRFYIGYSTQSPASFALNNSVFSSTSIILEGESRDSIIHAMKEILLLIQEQFKQLQLKGETSTLTRTLCLWSSLHGVLLTQKYHGDFAIPSPDHLVSTLLLGWGIPKSKLMEAQHQIDLHCDEALLVSFTSLDTKDNP